MARLAAMAATASYLGLALVLAGRRFQGALVRNPSANALVALVVLLAITGVLLHLALRTDAAVRYSVRSALLAASYALAGLLLLGTLTLRATATWETGVVVVLLLVGTFAPVATVWRRTSNRTASSRRSAADGGRLRQTDYRTVSVHSPPSGTEGGWLSEQDVTQQMMRASLPNGGEILYGRLQAYLAAGQRTAHAHVSFCPPLSSAPQVTVEQSSGPEAEVRIGQVLPWGARFDVRLRTISPQPERVSVDFVSRSSPPDVRA